MDSRQYTHELENDIMSTDQCDFMDYIDEELAAILGEDFRGSLSPAGSDSSSSSTLINNPQSSSPAPAEPPHNTNKFSDFSATNGRAAARADNLDKASSSPAAVNFQNAKSPQNSQQVGPWINPDVESIVSEVHRNEGLEGPKRVCTENKTKRPRPPSQTYDHIMAERKRREQLSQRFVALSAIIPGLKKMDKTSVLGDTIKYLKHLQERVKTLEEQAAKQTVESVVLVKKSQILEDEDSSDGKKSWACENSSLPEIEARVCDKSILFKIHCEKRKGVLVKILAQIDKFNLVVVSVNVTPFGNVALDITITAQMDKEMGVSAKDMVKTLRSALQGAG